MGQSIIPYVVLLTVFIVNQEISPAELDPENEYQRRHNEMISDVYQIDYFLTSLSNESQSLLTGIKKNELAIIGVEASNTVYIIKNKSNGCQEGSQIYCKGEGFRKLLQFQLAANLTTLHCIENSSSIIREGIKFEKSSLEGIRKQMNKSKEICRNVDEVDQPQLECRSKEHLNKIENAIIRLKSGAKRFEVSVKKNGYAHLKSRIRQCMIPISINFMETLKSLENEVQECLESSRKQLMESSRIEQKDYPIHRNIPIC